MKCVVQFLEPRCPSHQNITCSDNLQYCFLSFENKAPHPTESYNDPNSTRIWSRAHLHSLQSGFCIGASKFYEAWICTWENPIYVMSLELPVQEKSETEETEAPPLEVFGCWREWSRCSSKQWPHRRIYECAGERQQHYVDSIPTCCPISRRPTNHTKSCAWTRWGNLSCTLQEYVPLSRGGARGGGRA